MLLDPALVPGYADVSAVAQTTSVLIIGPVDNDFFPFPHYARSLAANVSHAATRWLDDGEGHFVFLDSCGLDIEAQGVPICLDRPGVERDAVHDRLAEPIVGFFERALEPGPR